VVIAGPDARPGEAKRGAADEQHGACGQSLRRTSDASDGWQLIDIYLDNAFSRGPCVSYTVMHVGQARLTETEHESKEARETINRQVQETHDLKVRLTARRQGPTYSATFPVLTTMFPAGPRHRARGHRRDSAAPDIGPGEMALTHSRHQECISPCDPVICSPATGAPCPHPAVQGSAGRLIAPARRPRPAPRVRGPRGHLPAGHPPACPARPACPAPPSRPPCHARPARPDLHLCPALYARHARRNRPDLRAH
jgi:hypothetical protein